MSGRVLLEYESPHPIYGIAFSPTAQQTQRIALTTLITGPSNKLSVVELDPSFTSSSSSSSRYPNSPSRSSYHDDYRPTHPSNSASTSAYRQIAQANLAFPASKVAFEPATYAASAGAAGSPGAVHGQGDERGGLIATSGDVLRIWDLQRDWKDGANGAVSNGGYVGRNGYGGQGQGPMGSGWNLETRSVLTSTKSSPVSFPPITSFAWNSISPERIVSCSIDTTATLWDIETTKAVTQLIAHDRAVYDLSWLPDSSDIFVSVGADGSLRAFDLRQLEHSTILYESVNETPLARIAFSNREQHMLACFGVDDSKILILDMRSPGQPVAELVGHQGPLSAIAWGSGGDGSSQSTGGGWIASCADDGQLLMYDLVTPLPESRPPSTAPSNGAGGKSKSGRSATGSGTGPNANVSHAGSSSRTNQNSLSAGPSGTPAYPHSFKPRATRMGGRGPNDHSTGDSRMDGLSPALSPSMSGTGTGLGGLGSGGGIKPTPIDPLMLGVGNNASTQPGSGSGGSGSGSGSGRTPSPGGSSTGRTSAASGARPGTGANDPSDKSSGGGAISIMPARAWSAGREISNLAFDAEGEWVGCVAGNRLSVLKV